MEGKTIRLKWILFPLLVILLNIITFGKAISFNFIDEDWIALWLSKYNFDEYKNYMLGLWHPGQILNTYPWVFIFGNSPFFWQLLGLLLKILAAFSLGLALYGIIGSIEAFYIGSLLYSVSAPGIETFTWASGRISAYLIILFNLAIYFYFSSLKKNKLFNFFVSLIFIGTSLLLDPYRAIPFVSLLVFWEFLTRIINKKLFTKSFLIRILLLSFISVLLLLRTQVGTSLLAQKPNSSNGYLMTLKASIKVYPKFVASIGTIFAFVLDPLKPYYRSGEVSKDSLSLGFIFFLFFLFSIIYFIKKRSTNSLNFMIFLLWIPLFYFPNWMADLDWSSNIYHRFLAISGEGLVMIICILLLNIPKKLSNTKPLLITIFMLSNLIVSVRIITAEYKVRGIKYTSPILAEIRKDLPKNTTRLGLWLQSNNSDISNYFGSGGSIAPYVSFITGARNLDDVVIIQDGGKLVCDRNLNRPLFFGWAIQKEPLPIEDVYGWKVNSDYSIENVSDYVRVLIANSSSCYKKNVNQKIDHSLTLTSYIYLDKLFNPNKEVVSLNFQQVSLLENRVLVSEIYTRNMELIDRQTLKVDSQITDPINIFFEKSDKVPYYIVLSFRSDLNTPRTIDEIWKRTLILGNPGKNI